MSSTNVERKSSGRGRGRGRGRPPGRPSKRGKKKTSNSRTDNDYNENEIENEIVTNETSETFSPKFDSVDTELTPPHPISFVSPSAKLMHKNEPLSWEYKVNLIGEKVINPRIHCCEKCKLPILVYGRMIPCKHIFCYSCAKQSDTVCPRCADKVVRVEKTGLGTVFMCQTESCKRTYLSQRDLEAHIQHRHLRRLVASASMNATSGVIASSTPLPNASSQSHSTSIQSSSTRNISFNNNSYQSPIPVVSSRSNLITVPIQDEVSTVMNQMPQTVNTQNSMIATNQPQVSNYVSPQSPYTHPPHMQWPPAITNTNAFPYGRPPWPPITHPYNNPYNRPYYQ